MGELLCVLIALKLVKGGLYLCLDSLYKFRREVKILVRFQRKPKNHFLGNVRGCTKNSTTNKKKTKKMVVVSTLVASLLWNSLIVDTHPMPV
jgi:hypothetical protein